QAEDGIRAYKVTGVQTCALPICLAPEARAERNALVDLESEAELGLQGLLHGEQRPPRGVVLGSLRQLVGDSPYCGYRHAGGGGRGHGDAIPERLDGKSEDVEADRDVADRGGRERARTRAWGRCAHSCAPRWAASRSRSANTPPAVTSGPAPGPCTM